MAICIIFAMVMRDAHRDAGRRTALSSANVAASTAHDVERNIELLDQSLQFVVKTWSNPRVQGLQPDIRDMILFDQSAKARGFGAILVLDAGGVIVAASDHGVVSPQSFSTRDYFLVHRAGSDIGLFISRPFLSKISNEWTLGLSRRLANPDGSFAGVVVGTLKLSYLEDLYKSVDLGSDSVSALLRSDGSIVTRSPFIEGDLRRNIRNTDAFSRIRARPAGTFDGFSAIDGKHRIISFHRLGSLPLMQVVEVSVDEAYASWLRKALVLGALLLGLCIGSLSLLALLGRELTRRTQAEAQLTYLVNTDPLTGLANRRLFEDRLGEEWGRAARTGAHLAVLVIDADYFKLYNDSLGHLAGDEALRLIAGAIRGSVHRPGDLPCRIGGEEFAVILPDTDIGGATVVGETIRHCVESLARPHTASPLQLITVSVGAASLRPRPTQSSAALVEAADAALYLAKSQGRNCVRSAGPAKPIALVA